MWICRIATTDVCVILSPNFIQVWGYPPINGQNIKFVPTFLLITSHFMFWTYQGLKKVGVGLCGGGGDARASSPWPIINSLFVRQLQRGRRLFLFFTKYHQ